jgi:hypothetical protein
MHGVPHGVLSGSQEIVTEKRHRHQPFPIESIDDEGGVNAKVGIRAEKSIKSRIRRTGTLRPMAGFQKK